MPAERVINEQNGKEYIVSKAVQTVNVYDMIILSMTHSVNVTALMANPDFFPYIQYLQTFHEDMLRMTGFLSLVFDITESEILEHTKKREDHFKQVVKGPEIEVAMRECHDQKERMYR